MSVKTRKRFAWAWCALAACLAMGLFLPVARAETAKLVPGVYLWGGSIDQGTGIARFQNSVKFVLDHGFTAVRFALSPNALPGYGVAPDACAGHRSLGCYLRLYLDSPAFDDDRLRMLMLTLSDFTGNGSFDPGILRERGAAIRAEYADALAVLEQRFRGRKIRFVISNWEGDNAVLCGSVFKYKTEPAFAEKCEPKIPDRIEGFRDWIALRREAIAAFRQTHPKFDVELAVEFNHLHIMEGCKTHCLPSYEMLTAMSKGGTERLPLCSYSSWGSLARHTLDADLDRFLAVCDKLIIGEMGFKEGPGGLPELTKQFAQIQTPYHSREARIPAVFIWNGFEDPDTKAPGFALFTRDGQPADVRALPPILTPR